MQLASCRCGQHLNLDVKFSCLHRVDALQTCGAESSLSLEDNVMQNLMHWESCLRKAVAAPRQPCT